MTKRVVVVGASTGLGRCIGIGLSRRGSKVALLARREDKIRTAAEEAGNGAVALTCDATDAGSVATALASAAEAMGGIDTVIYAAAVGPLVRLKDATADEWRTVFDTNVVGASVVTAAAIPYLTESAGNVLFMSTTGASYTPPWPGLALYQVTKTAMDRLVDAWRAEHPGIDFTRVTIGECPGGEGDGMTQFNAGWDRALAGELAPIWLARNYFAFSFIDIEHLVDQFHSLVTMGSAMQVTSMTIIPRPAIHAPE